jgi:hypothetical protein
MRPTAAATTRWLTGWSVTVCVLFFAGGATAAVDLHREARPVTRSGGGILSRPQHPDWYVLAGGADFNAIFTVRSVPAGCVGRRALEVSLYNPEGHFVETIRPVAGDYEVSPPPLPGRYLIQIAIDDPACAGLRYAITLVAGETVHAGQNLCDALHKDATYWSGQISRDRQLAKRYKDRGARARYIGYGRTAAMKLAQDRAGLVKSKC